MNFDPVESPQRVTAVFLDVIEYLSQHPDGAYGHVIVKETRNRGSVYSVLRRLIDAKWVTVALDGHGMPLRLLYALTPGGVRAADRLLAERRPSRSPDSSQPPAAGTARDDSKGPSNPSAVTHQYPTPEGSIRGGK